MEVPRGWAFASLRELAQASALRCEAKGWLLKSVTISGSPAQIALFLPVLDRWLQDQNARDAW